MFKWLKQLLCRHDEWKEIYCDIDGFCELHYCYICKECEKERVR